MLEVVGSAGPDPAAAHAFLLVVSGSEPGRLHILDRPEVVIGRSKYAEIHVSERSMSQQHAKLVRAGEFHRIYDLGSTNGTFVNNIRIEQADLKPGDTVRTGETAFTYMASQGQGTGEQTMMLPQQTQPPATRARPPTPMPGMSALARRNPYTGIVNPPVPPQVVEVPAYRPAEESPDLLSQILKIIAFFQRHWLAILLLTMLGGAAGVGSYKFMKPPARAEFEVSLVPQATDNPVEHQRRFNFEFFRSAANNFVRPGLIVETLHELGESDVPEDRIRTIQRRLEFQRTGEFSYTGAYAAPTTEESIQFLEVHLRLYLETEIEKALKVLIVEVDTLEQELAQAEQEMSATDQALLAFKQEHSDGLPEQASQLYEELIALGSEKGRASSEYARAAADMRLSKQRLKSESPIIESRIEMARPYEGAISDLKRKLAEAKAAGKGTAHPDVVSIKEQLTELETLRDDVMKHGTGGGATKVLKSDNPLYKDARLQADAAEAAHAIASAELSRLTNDLERTKKLVGKLPELQAEYSELQRSYEAVKKVHANLFEKLTASRIQLEMERKSAAARWDVITPPNVQPVSRVKTVAMRGAMGAAAGFFLGLLLGIARDLRRAIASRLASNRR
jgi:uncharacterized protein involved in exopolysaccharide biosynthesis